MTAPGPQDPLRRAMAEAVELAQRGRFRVEPNPLVGAVVLAKDGTVVGRGFHARWGGRHAEVLALADAGEKARGGTLVTTLEPCGHTTNKKTPPCLPAVLASGVASVAAGCGDPNPATHGIAARELAANGIAYEEGVLREACEPLALRHARQVVAEVPWTIAKWAMSADGRIADSGGHSRWITEPAAREVVHELRASVDAVVVGRGTVVADDPALTCRIAGGRSPLRVVLDTDLRTPADARVIATARETATLVICAEGADAGRRRSHEERGVVVAEVARGPGGRVKLSAAFRELHRRGVRRVLVEAGSILTGACLRAGHVRQVAAFVAPVILGGSGPSPFDGGGWPLPDAPRLEQPRVLAIGCDALLEGYWPKGGPAAA